MVWLRLFSTADPGSFYISRMEVVDDELVSFAASFEHVCEPNNDPEDETLLQGCVSFER